MQELSKGQAETRKSGIGASSPDAGKPTGAGDPRAAAAVFHDGGCPVCRREIGWYRGMTGAGAVEWVDVSVPDLPPSAPPGMDRESLLRRFTIRRRDGAVVDGAQGFVALWRALGPTRWLGILCDRWPLVQIAEIAYRLFLRVRIAWRRAA